MYIEYDYLHAFIVPQVILKMVAVQLSQLVVYLSLLWLYVEGPPVEGDTHLLWQPLSQFRAPRLSVANIIARWQLPK